MQSFLQDWGASADIEKMKWHVPVLEELSFADRLMQEFLQPEIDRLENFMEESSLDRYILMSMQELFGAYLYTYSPRTYVLIKHLKMHA